MRLISAAIALAALAVLASCAAAVAAEGTTMQARIPSRPLPPPCVIRAAGSAGNYTGFDLVVAGKSLAPARFSSNGLIAASTMQTLPNGALRFSGFRAAEASGLELSDGDFVQAAPGLASPYPEISFQLTVKKFDAAKWNAAAGGPCPFHFLTFSLDGAEAIHHRGWLVATPALDPYPLQAGRQGTFTLASKWSRDWTWAPPFGACPIPVAGLWAPRSGRYAAFDFTDARLKDHTEKLVASAYCWKQGRDRNFITLVYPFARNYIGLRHPQGGEKIASHFRVTYDLDLHSWEDPNQRYHERLWLEYYDLLPGAPALNDLSFLPGYARLNDFPRPAPPRFTYTVPKKDQWESNFFEEGTVIPEYAELQPLDFFYWQKDQASINAVKEQMPYLLRMAKRFQAGGEECCYWPKPLEGKSRPALGDVTTLRNIHGWSIAGALLCIYTHEKDASQLPVIDGVLNWTKYNICTRNDISDVPDAMFTIGWGGMDFCLRYYYTFRDDAQRAERAQLAYRLALSLAYRYTTMWIPDTAEDDNIEGTFLIEPNSGQPWTGAACANECCMFMNAFARLYAATGDPIILAYLRGMLERWPLLYQDEDAENLWDYSAPFAECFGIFDECQIGGRNKRSTYGGNVEPFDLIQPVAFARVRVVAGEKGAAAFNKRGMHTDITEFRSSKNLAKGLSFKVVSSLQGDFDLILTTPQLRLGGRRLLLKRGDTPNELAPGKEFVVPDYSPCNALIHGVRNGDVIALDTYDTSLPVVDCRPVKSCSLEPRGFADEGFTVLPIARNCDWAPKLDWEDADSYAPYFPGCHYAFGVPYFLVPAYLNGGKTAMAGGSVEVDATARSHERDARGTTSVPPVPARALAVLVSEVSPAARVTVSYEDGQSESVRLAERAVAWKAWPKWFKTQIDIAPLKCRDSRISGIAVQGLKLWGVTLANTAPAAAKVLALLDIPRAEKRQKESAERFEAQWRKSLAQGSALRLEADCVEPGYAYCYVCIAKGSWEIPKDSFLEYDTLIPYDSIRSNAGVDLTGGTAGNIRDAGIGTHPSQSNDPRGEWKHHRYGLAPLAGKTFEQVVIATDGSNCLKGRFKGCFKNIRLAGVDGNDLLKLYGDGPAIPCGKPEVAQNGGLKDMANWSATVVPAAAASGAAAARALVLKDGVAKDDFSAYAEGSDGSPTWKATDGAWVVKDRQFVGTNSTAKAAGWIASGASAGDRHWKDYRLALRFKIIERGDDWRDGPWIGFRNSGNGAWKYSLNFHSRNIALHKANLGGSTRDENPLAEVPWKPDNERHQVVIVADGNHIQVELDGKKIMDLRDENLSHLGVPPLLSGGIALSARRFAGSTGNTTVAFSDVEITTLH